MRVGGVLVLLAGCGGSPCERLCDVRAEAFEACFEPWQMSWASFSAETREEYVEGCELASKTERQAVSGYQETVLLDACSAALDAHDAAGEDCDAQWEAWQATAASVP